MALSDVAIRNAKPRDKEYKLSDGGGLYMLVRPVGGKLWRLKFRVDGREKKLAIGAYPFVMSMRSSTGSPGSSIPGPMARSSE